ncbi:MAG: DUF6932 family protein, partial [Planctomycetaceae bacterium]
GKAEIPGWDMGWRMHLVENLGVLCRQLWQVGISEIYVDGSFVEDKCHPNDIDGYFECDLQYLASGHLERNLNLIDPHKVWTWDPSDKLELFPLPEFEKGYGYRTWFWAHALRHLTEDGVQRLLKLAPDERIFPHCEPTNPVDSAAIELLSEDGLRIGYMPSYLLDDAHTLQETCSFCELYVDLLNPPPSPLQQRLLCRLESCWPDGFVPYATERYQPLSGEAAVVQQPVFHKAE